MHKQMTNVVKTQMMILNHKCGKNLDNEFKSQMW